MSGGSKNPDSIYKNNLKLLTSLNRLTYNRVKELKTRFPNGPNKHLSRGRFRLRPDCIPHFDEWASFTESLPSPQPQPSPPSHWANQQQPVQRGQQGFNQQSGHYQRGNSQMPAHSQRISQQTVSSQQRSVVTQQQNTNTGANGQTPAPEKKVDLSVANLLLSLGLTSKNSFNDKELKELEQQGRLPKKEERPSKRNGETSSVSARRTQPQVNQQRRQEEAQKVSQASTKSDGKQPAIKKPAQENVILSNSSVSASLAKCQSLLETYENIRKGRKRPILPNEDDIKFFHKKNMEKDIAMKRPQKRPAPALKSKSKEKVTDLDKNIDAQKKQGRLGQFIVTLKHGAKRNREGDDIITSPKSISTSKKRKTEHNSDVQTRESQAIQATADTNSQEVQTDPQTGQTGHTGPRPTVTVAVQTDFDLFPANISSSNSNSNLVPASELALRNDDIIKMANEAHKRYKDLFSKATNVKRQGDNNENPSDYAEAACYYADAFYEQLIAASLGHNENVVNPSGFMNYVITRFENKDKKIQASFHGLKALITRRFFLFEDKRVRPILKDTIMRYNELIEKTGRLSEQTLAYKREHYNKALSESNRVEDLVHDFTKYWERATSTHKHLGFDLESDIKVAVDYIRNLLREWRKDNDSKSKDVKKNVSQSKSRSNR